MDPNTDRVDVVVNDVRGLAERLSQSLRVLSLGAGGWTGEERSAHAAAEARAVLEAYDTLLAGIEALPTDDSSEAGSAAFTQHLVEAETAHRIAAEGLAEEHALAEASQAELQSILTALLAKKT